MAKKIIVPTLGESVSEASVAAWLKNVGDRVSEDELLVELETDKVTLEVPSPAAGVLTQIAVEADGVVGPGAVLGIIGDSPDAAAQATGGKPEPAPAPEAKAAAKPVAHKTMPHKTMPLSPAAAKAVAETGVEPANLQGSGKGGRLTKGDVRSAAESSENTASRPENTALRPTGAQNTVSEERVKMSRMRQTIARRLKAAQDTAAILTTWNEADMSEIMALRKQFQDSFVAKHGFKLGFMSFFTMACIAALKEIPAVNAEIQGDELVYKNYYNIGVAVGTESGLVVPVIKDADRLGFAGIEKAINDFGVRARDGKLGIDEMQGGTFTVSNGGVYGSLMSAPILNAPQSGILGMHKIQQRPVALKGEVLIRPMMYLALSYDHRIIDGREAVTFLVKVKEALEEPARLMLDL